MGSMLIAFYALVIVVACWIVGRVAEKLWQLDGPSWSAIAVLVIFACLGIGFHLTRALPTMGLEIVSALVAITIGSGITIGVANYWHVRRQTS